MKKKKLSVKKIITWFFIKAGIVVLVIFSIHIWMGNLYDKGGLTWKGKLFYNLMNFIFMLPIIILIWYVLTHANSIK